MKLIWFINRLSAMGPKEILTRVVLTFRKMYWRKQVGHWLSNVRIDIPEPQGPMFLEIRHTDDLIQSADTYLQNEWHLFGRTIYEPEINWHFDPYLQRTAPLNFGYDINHRDEAVCGDIKFSWEKNRHHHLTVLAAAYASTKDEKYAEAVREQILSWIDQNPVFIGVNWTHPLEQGIRLLSWVWCERLLRGSHVHLTLFGSNSLVWLSIYQHMKFVRETFCSGSSANNHLLGEMAGLYTACKAFPLHKDCVKWAELAKSVLEEELPKQTFDSGLNKEQAFGYQFFVLDFAMTALLEGRYFNDPFSAEYEEVTRKMLDVIPKVTDSGGNYPRYGDADEGKGLQLYSDNDAREAWLFRMGKRYLNAEVPIIKGGELTEEFYTQLLDGQSMVTPTADIESAKQSIGVEDAGVYVLSDKRGEKDEIFVLADAGPLGFLSIAAHGHADALSFTMSVGGCPIFVDPGTYTYYPKPKWRSWFRSTGAHNTVLVDERDQSLQGGSMLYTQKADTCVKQWTAGDTPVLVATHDGYAPLVHSRTLKLANRTLYISDSFSGGTAETLEWNFHLHPNCLVECNGSIAVIRCKDCMVRMVLPYECKVTIENSQYSEIYATKVDAKIIRAKVRYRSQLDFKTVIEVQ